MSAIEFIRQRDRALKELEQRDADLIAAINAYRAALTRGEYYGARNEAGDLDMADFRAKKARERVRGLNQRSRSSTTPAGASRC